MSNDQQADVDRVQVDTQIAHLFLRAEEKNVISKDEAKAALKSLFPALLP